MTTILGTTGPPGTTLQIKLEHFGCIKWMENIQAIWNS